MDGRTPKRGQRRTVALAAAASVLVASPTVGRTQDEAFAGFLNARPEDRVLLRGPGGEVGETAFRDWAAAIGLGPREIVRAGLGEAEMLELVCAFADDIDLAGRTPGVVADMRALIARAEAERATLRLEIQARPIAEPPTSADGVSARPECAPAPEPDDVAGLLAAAPGAAPYLIEQRLRLGVRRTSTIRIEALPDVQREQGGDAP